MLDDLDTPFTALADGDSTAVPIFWSRAWPWTSAYTRKFLAPADAEDAAQEALLKLLLQAPTFDRTRAVKPWLMAVAHFEVRTIRRKSQRRRETAHSNQESIAADARDVSLEDRWVAEAIADAARTLSIRDQEAFNAYLQDERPANAGFRKRLQRALERLRRAWTLAHPDLPAFPPRAALDTPKKSAPDKPGMSVSSVSLPSDSLGEEESVNDSK